MKKISYVYLAVEITRRCNLKCIHCMRGDAQDISMSCETIDNILRNTEVIYDLLFTGGEPTLNIDGMRYFLHSAKKYNVQIHGLNIVTNGVVMCEEIKELIHDYSEYISRFSKENNKKFNIKISISADKYHENHAFMALRWYKRFCGGIACITINRIGDVPIAKGRANEIEEALPYMRTEKHRICIKEKGMRVICPSHMNYQLLHGEQIIVLCNLFVTVHGNVIEQSVGDGEYTQTDKEETIFNVNSAKDYRTILV